MDQTPVDSAATESNKGVADKRQKAIIGISVAVLVLLVVVFFVWRSFQQPAQSDQAQTTPSTSMNSDTSSLASSSWTTPPADAAATTTASTAAPDSTVATDSSYAAAASDVTDGPVTADRMNGGTTAPSAATLKTIADAQAAASNKTQTNSGSTSTSNSNSSSKSSSSSTTKVTYARSTAAISPSSPNGLGGWYRTRPTVTVSPSSRPTWYRWRTSGSWSTYHSTLTVPEGKNTFQFYSREPNGVLESKTSITIWVDRTAPGVPSNLQLVANAVGSVKLAWTGSSDSLSGLNNYEVATTAGTVLQNPTTTSALLTGLTPGGSYTFHVRAVDKAGNKSGWSANISVVVAAPPVTSVITEPAAPDGTNGWFRTTPSITLMSNQPGMTYYDFGSGFLAFGSLLVPGSGVSTLTCYSVNTAGITEAPKTTVFKVDGVAPPTPTVYSATVSHSSNTTDVTLTWSAVSDAVSGLAGYQVLFYRNDGNGGDPNPVKVVGVPSSPGATQTCTIQNQSDASAMHFCVKAIDAAGNSSVSSIVFPAGAPSKASRVVAKASSTKASSTKAARAVARPQFDAQTPGLITTVLTNPPAPPIGYLAIPDTSYEVTASAPLVGKATVVLSFDPSTLHYPAANVRMMHYHGGKWVDVTTEVDVANSRVSGSTDSFSPFGLFEADVTSTPASSWQSLLVLALLGLTLGAVSLHGLGRPSEA